MGSCVAGRQTQEPIKCQVSQKQEVEKSPSELQDLQHEKEIQEICKKILMNNKKNISRRNSVAPKQQYFQNNKQFVKVSIEANICVSQLLNNLVKNQILKDKQFYKLKGLNEKSLNFKQNRFKNLQAREIKESQTNVKKNTLHHKHRNSQIIRIRFPQNQNNNLEIKKLR